MQLHHLAGDHPHIGLHVLFLTVEGGYPAEHDMVHAVDRALAGRGLIGGRPVDHIGAYNEIQFPAGEQLPQPLQVIGIGDIDGNIIGEQMYMKLVRHRHGHDPAADQTGLGLFRPGKFIHRQIHLVAHIADGVGQRLVGQGEGVEGAGEEGHLLPAVELEGAVVGLVPDDKLIDAVQCRRAVEVVEAAALVFVDQKQQLVGAQGKQPRLPLIGETGRGEQRVAYDVHGLLLYRLPIGGHALQQQPRQTAPAAVPHGFLLRKPLGIQPVVFQHIARRIQRRGYHTVGGVAQQLRQIVDHLVQLRGRQPQHERPQILGNIFGKFVVSGLQRLGQLHGDLVALPAGQTGRDAQQGPARPLTNHHRLADADQIGEMGRDLQGAAAAAGGIPGQQLHVDHLDHPRCGGFQVVQQDTGQLLRLQGAHRVLHRRAAYKGVLIPQGGQRKGWHFLPQQL